MLTVLTGIDSFTTIKTNRAWRVVTIVVLADHLVRDRRRPSRAAATPPPSHTVLDSLTLMLYLLVPWTALNLVDFFFVRRGHYAITDIFRPDGVYGKWGWRGLTAYGVGFAAMIPFMVLPPHVGLSYRGLRPRPPDQRRRLLVAGRPGRLRSGLSGSVPVAGPGRRSAPRSRPASANCRSSQREFNECLKASRTDASQSVGQLP